MRRFARYKPALPSSEHERKKGDEWAAFGGHV